MVSEATPMTSLDIHSFRRLANVISKRDPPPPHNGTRIRARGVPRVTASLAVRP